MIPRQEKVMGKSTQDGWKFQEKKYYMHHIDSSKWLKIWKAAEEANMVSKKLNKDVFF